MYFDNASSLPYSNNILKQFEDDFNLTLSNPHSLSNISTNTQNIVDDTRKIILNFINADDKIYDCIFTNGTTDSFCKICNYLNFNHNSKFIYTIDNHTSVLGIREKCLEKGGDSIVIDISNNNVISIIELNQWFNQNNKVNSISNKPNNTSNLQSNFNLIAIPLESNFSGKLYNNINEYINQINKKYLSNSNSSNSNNYRNIFLIDTAKYISTNKLNLSDTIENNGFNNLIDITAISFYKIFGFPTGIGALIIKKDLNNYINKSYFGGGTVSSISAINDYKIFKNEMHDYFEDGTINYISIYFLNKIIPKHIYNTEYIKEITWYFYSQIKNIKYTINSENINENVNDLYAFEIYDCDYNNFETFKKNHGSIITFNIKKFNNEYIGYKEIENVCALNNISIRTGCLCNIGACTKNLKLNHNDIIENFKKGHSCSKNIDIIDGKPTGAIRVSFSQYNTKEEIDNFIVFLKEHFIDYYKNLLINNSIVKSITNSINIEKIIIYPIKSCAGFEITSDYLNYSISEKGIEYDRNYCLLDSYGKKLLAKKYPIIVLIKPEIDLINKLLIISFKEKQIKISLSQSEFDNTIHSWFTDIIGINCKLIKIQEEQTNFSNQGNFLLINQASIDDLNDKLNKEVNYDKMYCEYSRFRPNFLVNLKEPYIEDTLSDIIFNQYSDNIFTLYDKCTRCGSVNVDPLTGIICNGEPLLTFTKYRRINNKTYFGTLLKLI